MIKYEMPSNFENDSLLSETMFAVEELPMDLQEIVSHKFNCVVSKSGQTLSIINDGVYGGSYREGAFTKICYGQPGIGPNFGPCTGQVHSVTLLLCIISMDEIKKIKTISTEIKAELKAEGITFNETFLVLVQMILRSIH